MMIRSLLISLAFGTALACVQAAPSYAQTTETDQSEEDWRKSRKKRSTTPDIFDPNVNGIGQGLPDIKPLTPIEKLPRDSQRHLKKLRAEIIAESDPGQPADTTFKPSEAAQNDPDLAAQEEEAWKIIVTDLELGGGQNGQPQDQGQDGEKIAVVGRNPNPPSGQGTGGQGSGQGGGQSSGQGSTVLRGGSSGSVADILAQIKGIKAGQGQGGGQSPQDQGQGGGQSPRGDAPFGIGQPGQAPFGIGQGGGTSNQSPQGQGQQGQSQSGQSGASGQQNGNQGQPQNQGQSQSQGQTQSGQNGAQGQQNNGNQNQNGSQSQSASQSASQGSGQNTSQNSDQGAAQSQASNSNSRQRERLSPLESLKRARNDRVSGDTTSARDFLKTPPVSSPAPQPEPPKN